MPEETVVLHLIRPEDFNHDATLLAGEMVKWLVEAGLIAAFRLVGWP
jgi:acyl-CoA hydrolase